MEQILVPKRVEMTVDLLDYQLVVMMEFQKDVQLDDPSDYHLAVN